MGKNIMYCFHYRCNDPAVLPAYSSDRPLEELNDEHIHYSMRHSTLWKAFPDGTPKDTIIEYFKKAHEDKVNGEIEQALKRIENLKARVSKVNSSLTVRM